MGVWLDFWNQDTDTDVDEITYPPDEFGGKYKLLIIISLLPKARKRKRAPGIQMDIKAHTLIRHLADGKRLVASLTPMAISTR